MRLLFAGICKFTRFLRLPVFIQVVNVLNPYFRGQRVESNALASAYMKSARNALPSLLETLRVHIGRMGDNDGKS